MRKLRDIKKKIEKKPRETGEFEGGSRKKDTNPAALELSAVVTVHCILHLKLLLAVTFHGKIHFCEQFFSPITTWAVCTT